MASFKKRGDRWLAEIRIKGRYASKTHNTKNEAKEWALVEEHRLSQSKVTIKGKSFAEALERYALEEAPKKKGARWEEIRLKKIQRDAISSVQLGDLGSEDFEGWIKRQEEAGLQGSSINRELHVMSAVLTKARKHWKWMEGNPLENVARPKEPPPRNKCIDAKEVKNILAALEYDEKKPIVRTPRQKIAVAFLLAIETAMRQGEIWNMHWQHIQWKECYVHLPETKNGTSRDVALSKKAIQLLQSLEPKTQTPVMDISQNTSGVMFRRAVELAGYKGIITFHDTRHTAVTHLALKLDMLTLARMIGHKDPRNLMIYYNPTPKSIAKRLG